MTTPFYHGLGSKKYADARKLVSGDDWQNKVIQSGGLGVGNV